MLRLAVIALLLANAGYYAWSQGWLRTWGLAPVEQSEPQRLAQQLHPETLRILQARDSALVAPAPASAPPAEPALLPASTAASAPPTATVCLQAGALDPRQADAVRSAAAALPQGSWSLESTAIPGRWMVYMGRFADDEALGKKRAELRARKVDHDRAGGTLELGLSLGRFTTKDAAERERYVQRIRVAFLDLDGPDRLHAAETLGKLGDAKRSTQLLNAATQADTPIAAYARLILANTGAAEDAEYLAALLGSYDDDVRDTAGYALRFAPKLDERTLARVRNTALAEPEKSPARLNLLIAWLAHADKSEQAGIKTLLRPYAESQEKSERYQFGEAMALRGDADDVPVLLRLLDDKDTDVRISAANALLAIERR